MADISKCPGECNGIACSVRERCRRYVVQPSERQSWILPESMGEDCEYFWPVRETTEEGR